MSNTGLEKFLEAFIMKIKLDISNNLLFSGVITLLVGFMENLITLKTRTKHKQKLFLQFEIVYNFFALQWFLTIGSVTAT